MGNYWLYILITYAFQSESTLYSCLNVKELLAQSRCKIWSLSDCNWTRTHNHLVCKRTLNHLANWLNGWVLVYEVRGCELESSCSHRKLSNEKKDIKKNIEDVNRGICQKMVNWKKTERISKITIFYNFYNSHNIKDK